MTVPLGMGSSGRGKVASSDLNLSCEVPFGGHAHLAQDCWAEAGKCDQGWEQVAPGRQCVCCEGQVTSRKQERPGR